MRVVTAQLAGGERNADRVLVANDAVVLLDGATAFQPVDTDPGEYAEYLGTQILRRLGNADIRSAISEAIAATAAVYKIRQGNGPSSTVSVFRIRDGVADIYTLGDSSVICGSGPRVYSLTDDRISRVAVQERANYVRNLQSGFGFCSKHREDLAVLQREQARHRNRPGGFWIAESDPVAAMHGYWRSFAVGDVAWAIMATDGVTDGLQTVLPAVTWEEIAFFGEPELSDLLMAKHQWERDVDPEGRVLPRAKRHDDKSIVAITGI